MGWRLRRLPYFFAVACWFALSVLLFAAYPKSPSVGSNLHLVVPEADIIIGPASLVVITLIMAMRLRDMGRSPLWAILPTLVPIWAEVVFYLQEADVLPSDHELGEWLWYMFKFVLFAVAITALLFPRRAPIRRESAVE